MFHHFNEVLMNKLIPLAAVLTVAIAMPAHAATMKNTYKTTANPTIDNAYFNDIDINRDGVISRSENDMFSAATFHGADVNGDGVLSRNELLKFKTSGYRYTAQGSPYQNEKESTGGIAGNDLQPSAGMPRYPGSKSEYPTARNDVRYNYYDRDRMVRY
jgi:hypothetical protein